MRRCFKRRSRFTSVVCEPAHASKLRVALTMFTTYFRFATIELVWVEVNCERKRRCGQFECNGGGEKRVKAVWLLCRSSGRRPGEAVVNGVCVIKRPYDLPGIVNASSICAVRPR